MFITILNPLFRAVPKRISAVLLLSLFLLPGRAHAQLDDFSDILKGGAADANTLLEAYLKPYGSGFGANLNSGWVNTARPYKTLGFDLRLGVAYSIVPSTDEMFDIAELGLTSLKVLGAETMTPTVVGPKNSGPALGLEETFVVNGASVTETLELFKMPQGIGFNGVPSPMAQLTVGLIKDTDVSVRYIPPVSVPDVAEVSMWGVGVRHGLNQWIPGGGLLPVDIAVQAGYTVLSSSASVEVLPSTDPEVKNTFAASTWDGQGIELEASAFTANILVGKNLPFLAGFVGIGYEASTLAIKTPGKFPVTSPNPDYIADGQKFTVEAIDGPLDVSIDGTNSIHGIAGARFRLGVLTISASYTVADYSVANVGVGLSFR